MSFIIVERESQKKLDVQGMGIKGNAQWPTRGDAEWWFVNRLGVGARTTYEVVDEAEWVDPATVEPPTEGEPDAAETDS